MAAAPAEPAIDVPAATVVTPTPTSVRRSRAADDDRRRQLWRDSATILIAVVLVLLAGQVFIPQQTAGPVGSPTPLPSQIAIGSLAPPVSLPPGATFGPIINPSLGVDATPTPIPVITMGPTPSPTPSIEPTTSLRATPKPTVKPTIKPTPKPTVKPTATPKASRTPGPSAAAPIAAFTWVATGLQVNFSNGSSGDTAWSWTFGDPLNGFSTSENPSYIYAGPGDYTVKLTVTGPGGSDSVTDTVTVGTP